MPVNSCSSGGKPGYKWGDGGKCYPYNPNSEASKKAAKKKALAQGIAIGDIDIQRLNEVATTSMQSGIKNPQQGYGRNRKMKKEFTDQEIIAAIKELIMPSGAEAEAEGQMSPESGDSTEAGLNERQMMQYETYESIVENFGMFDQSSNANGAHYAPASANPFKDAGLICSNCVFYEGGGGCEIVSGDIEPNAICKLWIIPEKLLNKE